MGRELSRQGSNKVMTEFPRCPTITSILVTSSSIQKGLCPGLLCLKTISFAYRPFGYFELDPLSLFEPFLWTLVSGQGANKAVLYLESDQKCNYRKLQFFSISVERSFIKIFVAIIGCPGVFSEPNHQQSLCKLLTHIQPTHHTYANFKILNIDRNRQCFRTKLYSAWLENIGNVNT